MIKVYKAYTAYRACRACKAYRAHKASKLSRALSRALQDSPRLRWFIRFIEDMGLIRFIKVYKAHKAYHYQAYRLIESLQAL